jgi:hypothetical protein
MNKVASPYYPPRARWYSPVLYGVCAIRRRLGLEKIHPPAGMSFLGALGSLLLPGWAFCALGRRVIGRSIMGGCGLLALLFILWLGYPFANVLFGLLISAHASSILCALDRWIPETSFGRRMAWALAVTVVVSGCVYFPLRTVIQEHWLLPLTVNDQVVIVHKLASVQSVAHGEWIAYRITGRNEFGFEAGVWVHSGYGLRPVLAMPGDRVRFLPGRFEINGRSYAALPHMPAAGELVVPEKHWFVWPEFDIRGHGVGAETLSNAMLTIAVVSENEFVGKPFKRWFWRRQLPL